MVFRLFRIASKRPKYVVFLGRKMIAFIFGPIKKLQALKEEMEE